MSNTVIHDASDDSAIGDTDGYGGPRFGQHPGTNLRRHHIKSKPEYDAEQHLCLRTQGHQAGGRLHGQRLGGRKIN